MPRGLLLPAHELIAERVRDPEDIREGIVEQDILPGRKIGVHGKAEDAPGQFVGYRQRPVSMLLEGRGSMQCRLIEDPCFNPPVCQCIEQPLADPRFGDPDRKALPRGLARSRWRLGSVVLLGDLRQACAGLPPCRQNGIEIRKHGESDRSRELAHLGVQASASRLSSHEVEIDHRANSLGNRRLRKDSSALADTEGLRGVEGEHLGSAPRAQCCATFCLPPERCRRIHDQGHTSSSRQGFDLGGIPTEPKCPHMNDRCASRRLDCFRGRPRVELPGIGIDVAEGRGAPGQTYGVCRGREGEGRHGHRTLDSQGDQGRDQA